MGSETEELEKRRGVVKKTRQLIKAIYLLDKYGDDQLQNARVIEEVVRNIDI